MKTCLSIGGFDPCGGAGVQIDNRVFYQFGLHPLSVITALTIQNTIGVEKVIPVDSNIIKKQLKNLIQDIKIDSLKIGMLYSVSTVKVVVDIIKQGYFSFIVVDPVMVSSSGKSLIEKGLIKVLCDKLLPVTTFVTPNLYEASLISNIEIKSKDSMLKSAEKILSYGVKAVVITTGDSFEKRIIELYYDGKDIKWIESEKIPGNYHGTGCVFSSAIASHLTLGKNFYQAVLEAKNFVTYAIKNAYYPGKGMGILKV